MTAASAHRRMLVEHLLDLARVDVVAAADDHVLLAVDDEVVAVGIDAADVAGVEPTVRVDRLGRRVGALPVALHDIVAADGDLAGVARGDIGACLVDEPNLDARDRGAHRAGLALAIGVVERDHG